uniref:Thioredoxin n=1 Tax=Marseillevirus LCMAC102 TaxID=2506603 RepID=A0A481YTS0_9VIRU|nr:MAG: thioredoxin [Marseillevirus LCMAC102]
MSVHQLSPQNFKVVGRNIKTLNINLSGNVLVFFKMQGCPGCGTFEPIFHQLAGASTNDNIKYAACDLTNQRDIIKMSRQTSTPIQAVPFIILYVNGNPLAKYTGKKSIPAIKSFMTKALQHVPPVQSQNFMPQQRESSGGMYGNGSYNPPQMSPNQGQSGVNQQHDSSDGKIWMPELGKAPSMQGVVKGSGGSQYAYLNDIDEDDEEKLSVPEQVTPHNVPWESQYRKMGTID